MNRKIILLSILLFLIFIRLMIYLIPLDKTVNIVKVIAIDDEEYEVLNDAVAQFCKRNQNQIFFMKIKDEVLCGLRPINRESELKKFVKKIEKETKHKLSKQMINDFIDKSKSEYVFENKFDWERGAILNSVFENIVRKSSESTSSTLEILEKSLGKRKFGKKN